MNQLFLIHLSEITLLIVACLAGLVTVIVSVYDIFRIIKRQEIGKVMMGLRYPRQPHVTILVYAYNCSETLLSCLASIRRSRYRSYDVVVVDNLSTDVTKQVIRLHRQKYPNGSICFHIKRKQSSRLDSLKQAYKKSQKGDIVFTMSADDTITPVCIKQSVARFVVDPHLLALRLNRSFAAPKTITALIHYIVQLNANMLLKCYSLVSGRYVFAVNSAVVYTSRVFGHMRKDTKIAYAYDSTVMTHAQRSSLWLAPHRPLGSVIVIVPLVIILFFITFFSYTAMTLQSSSLLMISWLIVSFWSAAIILSDETSRVYEKLVLLYSVPILYFLLYVYAAMRIVDIVRRGGVNFGKQIRRKKTVNQMSYM